LSLTRASLPTRNFTQQRPILDKIIKSDIVSTNMAGHEYLLNAQIVAPAKQIRTMQRNVAE